MSGQDPHRDSPLGSDIASGMFAKARAGQYPPLTYLGYGMRSRKLLR